MHEFSLCQRVISIVLKKTQEMDQDAKKVSAITLRIGQLAGVDVESMQFWFPVAAKNTSLSGASLKILIKSARACCVTCNNEYEVVQFYAACPQCQSYEKDIICGREMLVDHIEFEMKK
ncbi:hydrogenase maturation nickel metallochaperone HypA [Caedibacter taeniospiralis]|jgi:hydrogenase nickel incorporation protein HypA/HybF|uniref:hydrogenase maturation nickel metallochaperone HypA n=1 Tax=Caedibacter taeniospiralis TaxID=28907 RepID=UPI0037BEA24C